MNPGDRHLDSAQVMARYGISKPTLYRWMKDADLSFPRPTKINRRYYFREADLHAWEMQQGRIDADEPETVNGNAVVSEVIQTYQDFVAAMVARRKDLKLACHEVDLKAGMQEGYANKLENPFARYGRGVGPDTLPLWLGGLRVGIVLVDLPRRPYVRRKDRAA